ncbi:arylsulfatase [Neotabrizicola shimadae]|uniref:Arylsulfatase n=1 Tax=Neotabrizicola shimadae TaxID=2807096 RepID=A0A8G0ZV23_9RHOB|nr:arylsulfatase [Neotabrizicola shimadae]QYZ70668.1 arylsulfatase [Neotabrizicola shimadae]
MPTTHWMTGGRGGAPLTRARFGAGALVRGGTVLALAVLAAVPAFAEPDRTVLPLAEPPRPVSTVLDVRDAVAPPIFEVTAPEGAPNVLLILIDDLGFGGTSAFGGPVSTPSFDAIAQEGVRFTNFHTQATCSPTRAALLSGRNHHVANMGGIAESGTAFPGNTTQIPNEVASIAEILRLNGYSTAAFGKWHQTPPWETSVSGPFDRWPTGQGFDKFYGFIGFSTNEWAPAIIDGTVRLPAPDRPGYNFMEDVTDQAVNWIRFQKAITPDRPFFAYFAPGAVRAPHHVPEDWAARWKGRFDQGWDEMRRETLARQIEAGVVPAGTELTPRPEAIPAWNSLTDDEKRLYTRQAEVFAGFLEYTDHEIGRVIEAVRETGQLDNTLVIFVAGDNGSGAEGGRNGTMNEFTYFNNVEPTVEELLPYLDRWGGPETLPNWAGGWAMVFNTPYEYVKQVASDFGGTKVGMAIRWPEGGVPAGGGVRGQFTHVVDVAPTILEAAGLPEPVSVNGTAQRPMDGTSLAYAFGDAAAPERHVTQYFEMFGNQAIYHEGWLARSIHRAPWEAQPRSALKDSRWELYDTRSDFSLNNDLAAAEPERLAELRALFLEEASRNFALPMDDRTLERAIPALAGRPDLMAGRNALVLAEGMTGMGENVFLDVKNRSLSITAEVVVPEGGGNGAILVQGGRFGGWALYMKDGVPAYEYNFLGLERFVVTGEDALPPGPATIRFDFAYDGGGPGRGGLGRLSVNGKAVGEGRIGRTQPLLFSADETADVGIDLQTPVAAVFRGGADTRFDGKIATVTVEVNPGP